MQTILGPIALVLIIYPFGVLLAISFLIMRALKYVRVAHWDRFPHFKKGIIVVVNHPSMLDPFLIGAMFFRGYLLNPLRYGPVFVVDKINFYDSWYMFWLRPFMIPVDRESRRSEVTSFRRIKYAIVQVRTVVIFPEGGRTFRGNDFLFSKKGHKIRILKEGVGLLVDKTDVTVIPVWIEGTEKFLPNSTEKLFTRFRFNGQKPMLVNIGKPLNFNGKTLQPATNRKEISRVIANSLLELADQ